MGWESFIIHLDILNTGWPPAQGWVENLSLFTLIYLVKVRFPFFPSWESFIIHLDILKPAPDELTIWLRIFHYSPWYTYSGSSAATRSVENLSLFTLIYLYGVSAPAFGCWESFIIHLDILSAMTGETKTMLRIFHYSPWYTYASSNVCVVSVENLSLFTLIYLTLHRYLSGTSWESFIIHLDILTNMVVMIASSLRIFHYSPWYT